MTSKDSESIQKQLQELPEEVLEFMLDSMQRRKKQNDQLPTETI